MNKWSRYNYMFHKDGTYLLYNSISNSFVEMSKETYAELEKIKSGEIESVGDELKEELYKMKAIGSDDDFEIAKIHYVNLCRRFSQQSMALTINPTLGCNFRCPYCFEGEHNTAPRMTDEVENAIVDFIKRHQFVKKIGVTWFGGEPLMEFERMRTLTYKMLDLGIAYSASIITNGYLLNEERIKSLYDLKIQYVQITLDGMREIHDKRRCLKNGNPTFDHIMDNVKMLAKMTPKIHVGIRVNLDDSNTGDFINLYNYIDGMNLKNVAIHPAFVKDYTGNCSNLCALDGDRQYAFIKDQYIRKGLTFSRFYPSGYRTECSIRNMNTVTIGPLGELYKCWNDVGKPEKVYGSVFSGTSNEKVLMEYLMGADPFEDLKCRKCILLPVCSGGCPYDRLEAQKNGKLETCPLMKNRMEDHLWIHYLSKKQQVKA